MKNRVFLPSDVLLPPYEPADERWSAYSVIACDQFTSEPEYWEKAEKLAEGQLSTLSLVLPEAYLETEKEASHKKIIENAMESIEEKLALHENCFVYVERILPDGRLRRGIVGKIDLESYDFSPDSKSAVRATEKTVVERIPPRVAVRKSAHIELPHVMVFLNDPDRTVIEGLTGKKDGFRLLYSFELMLGGGSVSAYKISGQTLLELENSIAEYEERAENGLVYAMGDGNHSLASAKAHYENLKKELGEGAVDHPARYALCEVVNLFEDSIEFEPIYRILINCDAEKFLSYCEKRAKEEGGAQSVIAVVGREEKKITIPALHSLTVGSLQMLIDEYLKENPSVICDYIHGTDSLFALCNKENTLGFIFDGVEKGELFSYVEKNGTLPRKTFSMGEAAGKRYYIEARKITK